MAIIWRCDKGLLRPTFSDDVEKLFKGSKYTFYALSGTRSMEEQKVLWEIYQAGGPKAAPPGKSAHNYGLAVDVVLDVSDAPGLQPSWDTKLAGWLWLKQACFKHPRLQSGWSFGDWPHIQQYKWRQYA